MKALKLTLSVAVAFAILSAQGATTIISDNYTATTSGTGFGLNAGVNTGINPPTTRLTGSAAASLRYFQTVTSRAASHYDLNSNRLRVTADVAIGRFVLSANGSSSFDFGPALGTSYATPGNPASYDVKISLRNDATANSRLSFGIATIEGDVNNLDFGIQVFRAATGNNFYTIQKRIDRGSFNGTTTTDGTGDVNATMVTAQANTAATMMDFLIRVTDAGSESGSSYNSRIQVSTNAGSSWIYDTDSDSAVSSHFRFDGTERHFVFDQAGNTTGSVYYDGFSVTWNSGSRAWTGAGTDGNWSTSANWGGASPVSGSTLTFDGTTRQTSTNDISSLSVPWLEFNNGGFALYGNALIVTSAITNTTGNSALNAALTLGGAVKAQSVAGTLTLGGNITGSANNLTVDGAGNTTASGAISGTGSLTKNGSGTLQLSGSSANTLSGNTVVNSGTLSLAKTAGVNAIAGNLTIGDGSGTDVVQLDAANQIADAAAVTISAGGSLDLNGNAETVASISSTSSSSQIALGAGTLTLGDANATAFAGAISGSGNLIKQGSGTLTLSGASSFSGTTTISAGAVNIQNAAALGSTGATLVNNGTALEIQGGIAVSGEPLTLNGTGLSAGGALRNISGNNSWSGTTTLGSATTIQSDSGTLTLSGNVAGSGQNLTVSGAGNAAVSGVISGSGTLTKSGSGTLTLSGANTFSGDTTISAGTLALGSGGSISSSPNITLANGTTLDVSAVSLAVGGNQTLSYSSTSGTATLQGSATLASGAYYSSKASGSTVGKIAVTGNLTLNNNTILIEVTGTALGAGTYTVLTHTGTRTGSFNAVPNLTGLGLAAGLAAKIQQTSGTISLQVYSPTNSATMIRVMTYNIHSAVGPDGQVNTDRIANYILAQDADLIGMNEVARNMPRSNGRDLIAEIAQKTGYNYAFSNNDTSLTGDDQFGNAILSKYPILFKDHRLLPKVGSNEQRGWLKTIVDVNGQYVSFQCTHLDFHASDTERLKSVTNINTWQAEDTVSPIIVGDFNDTPNTSFYNLMEQKWTDIWPVAGDGSLGRSVPCPGYPSGLNARIDYIWKAKNWNLTPTNAFVGYTVEGSDHYPVLTDFILKDSTNHKSGFYFPFNAGTGTNVVDSVAGLKGILDSGAPSWNTNSPTGQSSDYSLWFNGTKKLTVPDPKQLIGTNGLNGDYTLQCWVKVAVNYAPAQRAILFQDERKPGFSFSINTNRTLHTTAFKVKDVPSSAALPNDGAWHHIAVVHSDGVNMKFYIDGALSATVAYTNGVGYRTSSTITMGSDADGANPFTGFLDRVRFDNHILTPAQLDYPVASPDLPAKPNAFEIWKTSFGINNPDADDDHDGQSNLAEFLAHTNPTNADSALRILDAKRDANGNVALTWASIGGVRYRIQSSDGLNGEFTDVVQDAASEMDASPNGEASTKTFTDISESTNTIRFYRVKVVP